jgi:hypothetical protein
VARGIIGALLWVIEVILVVMVALWVIKVYSLSKVSYRVTLLVS